MATSGGAPKGHGGWRIPGEGTAKSKACLGRSWQLGITNFGGLVFLPLHVFLMGGKISMPGTSLVYYPILKEAALYHVKLLVYLAQYYVH